MGVLKIIGLIKFKEHEKKVGELEQKYNSIYRDYITVKKSNDSNAIRLKEEQNDKDSITKELDNSKSYIDKLLADIIKIKTELADKDKMLNKKIKMLQSSNGLLEDKLKDLKQKSDGKIGGLTKELNRIRSQLRFSLGILFKDSKSDKETEIYLKKEYKKLKLWDEIRRTKTR